MQVKIDKTEKNEIDLYERYGCGVHLLKKKDSLMYVLMIICGKEHDVLFIYPDNTVTHLKSKNDKLLYNSFDSWYEYVKKLEPEEIKIEVKK